MQYQYPHSIENGAGERLVFKWLVNDAEGDYLEVENFVEPNCGPPMHVHFEQEESLTIVRGKMGAQIHGKEPEYYGVGDTVTFVKGVPHRFWNAGTDILQCVGHIKPAHNCEYFLTEIFQSMQTNGNSRPGTFDSAWLLDRYRTEFDMIDIPDFVKKVIFPTSLFIGKLRGKQIKFKNAPAPISVL